MKHKMREQDKIILTQTDRVWDGHEVGAVNLAHSEISVVRITVPVGKKLPIHKHPMINVAYMLEGELTVHTETGEQRTFHAGEPIVEVIDTWHYGENTGNEPVEMVVTYVGEKGMPLTENR